VFVRVVVEAGDDVVFAYVLGVPHPVDAAGWSDGPDIVPSARLVNASGGAGAPLPELAGLLVRKGAAFTFC